MSTLTSGNAPSDQLFGLSFPLNTPSGLQSACKDASNQLRFPYQDAGNKEALSAEVQAIAQWYVGPGAAGSLTNVTNPVFLAVGGG